MTNFKKKFFSLSLLLFIGTNALSTDIPVTKASVPTTFFEDTPITTENISNDDTASPCADEFIWVRKTINGKKYKRKYNISKNEWVGGWIPY